MTGATDSGLGTRLVGRDHELERLAVGLHDVEAAAGRIVLLSGEAGVGKSRLVREIASLARGAGGRVALGAAFEGAVERPFGLVIDLLRAAASGATGAREACAAAVGALSQAPSGDPAASRWAQIDAVADAFDVASSVAPPLRLVAIEDLHWADASTLELLTQVLRRVEAMPLLVVATFRPPAANAGALLAFADSMRQLFGSERIELGPIAADAAAELVRAAAGAGAADADVAMIVRRGEGNPLFLQEAAHDAARAARDGQPMPLVPTAIRELVQRRAAALPPEARDVAAVLAVLDETTDTSTLASLLDVTPEAIANALDMLVGQGIVAARPDGRFAFTHAVTRDAVYEWIPVSRRQELHARCARLIEAEEGETAAARVARHVLAGGGRDAERTAAILLASAGAQSLARLAYEQAAEQLTSAVALMANAHVTGAPWLEARLRLAEARRLTRADDASLDAFAAVADDAAAAGDVHTEAVAAVGYERTYLATGRRRTDPAARSIPLLDRALVHLEQGGEQGSLLARVLAASAQARYFAGDGTAALDASARAIAVARAAGDVGAEAAALNTKRAVEWGPDDPGGRIKATQLVFERARDAGDIDLQLEGLFWGVAALMEVGRRLEAEAMIARFGTLAGPLHSLLRSSEYHRMRAMLAQLDGDFETARAEAGEALRLGLEAGNGEIRISSIAMAVVIGNRAERAAAVKDLNANVAPAMFGTLWNIPAAYFHACAGDLDLVRRFLDAAPSPGELDRDYSWLLLVGFYAEAAYAVGDSIRAREAYELLLPYADRYIMNNVVICYGSVERLLAKLADLLGLAEAEVHRRRGNERNEAIGARAWLESAQSASTRVTKTFMFTDIVKSTNLAAAMGDDAWELLLRWHNQALEEQFRAFGGEEVVSTGDGFFVAFETADAAIDCAIAIQRALAEHRRTTGFAPQVRIGVHAAEATAVDQNYHGVGVHEAARIAALAAGGEIIASASTAGRRLTLGPARQEALKGIAEPVEVVALSWR